MMKSSSAIKKKKSSSVVDDISALPEAKEKSKMKLPAKKGKKAAPEPKTEEAPVEVIMNEAPIEAVPLSSMMKEEKEEMPEMRSKMPERERKASKLRMKTAEPEMMAKPARATPPPAKPQRTLGELPVSRRRNVEAEYSKLDKNQLPQKRRSSLTSKSEIDSARNPSSSKTSWFANQKTEQQVTLPTMSKRRYSNSASDSSDDDSAASISSLNASPSMAYTVNRNHPLGSGGFGTVYKGFDNIRGEHVAVKEAHVGFAKNLDSELRGEFDLLKELDHPHIVKVRDFKIENGVAQIFMEWMSSGSVHSILESNGFRLHELAIRRYASESLKGLEYLHSKGMLHRDIKPANMLVSGTGAVKLSDFGTSRVQETTSTTQHVVGTCAYMSPETIRGRYSEGSDMWAWACSVVEMASGAMPWSHLPREMRGNIQLMFHIGSSQPPDHHPAIPEQLSTALSSILNDCFEHDASKRPSAATVLASPYFKAKALPSTSDLESVPEYQERVASSGGDTSSFAMTDTLQTMSTLGNNTAGYGDTF